MKHISWKGHVELFSNEYSLCKKLECHRAEKSSAVFAHGKLETEK